MSTNKVPIIDRNGKATHVWRKDHDTSRNQVVTIPAPSVVPYDEKQDPAWLGMDSLYDHVQEAKALTAKIKGIDSKEPRTPGDARNAWAKELRQTYDSLVEKAISCQWDIENLEAELVAVESQEEPPSEEDLEMYNVSVGEVRFQKNELVKTLNEAGILNPLNLADTSLSPRVYRTWEMGVEATREVMGRPDIVHERVDGSTHMVYQRFTQNARGNDELGFTSVVVNRLGNVTQFMTPAGKFTASSIDFPIKRGNENELVGETSGNIDPEDIKKIIYISTGRR